MDGRLVSDPRGPRESVLLAVAEDCGSRTSLEVPDLKEILMFQLSCILMNLCAFI